jgi:hypothetical protein
VKNLDILFQVDGGRIGSSGIGSAEWLAAGRMIRVDIDAALAY